MGWDGHRSTPRQSGMTGGGGRVGKKSGDPVIARDRVIGNLANSTPIWGALGSNRVSPLES
jgi:hypothetical protein